MSNQATQIAAAARYGTANTAWPQTGSVPTSPVIEALPHEWEFLARRAKTFGATVHQDRCHDAAGRPSMTVTARDGSTCRVVRAAI